MTARPQPLAASTNANVCWAIIASSSVAMTRTSTAPSGGLMRAALAAFAPASMRTPSHASRAWRPSAIVELSAGLRRGRYRGVHAGFDGEGGGLQAGGLAKERHQRPDLLV